MRHGEWIFISFLKSNSLGRSYLEPISGFAGRWHGLCEALRVQLLINSEEEGKCVDMLL